ncbi:MAG: SPOR domain-containing protein [Gallionella sp.]|nr:SPOR domain-containing protein [Gallionella sp.]
MSRNTGNKSAAPRKSSPLLTGILIGMVVGVGLAAGLAWFIMRSPSPFVQKDQVVVKPPIIDLKSAPAVAPPVVSASSVPVGAVSGVEGEKPRFEFYKVLTDKQETVAATPKSPEKTVVENKPAANVPQYLQAGSFASADDAEKLKAKLTLQGMEVTTVTVNIPEKGVWHRVRVGPYKNADDLSKARAVLKQNGIEATPTRAQ